MLLVLSHVYIEHDKGKLVKIEKLYTQIIIVNNSFKVISS